jgi:hypothetical protein
VATNLGVSVADSRVNYHNFINSASTIVNGAAGNDWFSFNIGTSADSHTIIGGAGIDMVDFGLATTAIAANLAIGAASVNQIGTQLHRVYCKPTLLKM